MGTPAKITAILQSVGTDPDALEKLYPQVYAQLRAIAANRMKAESANHTLQPTALVHEVYFRLAKSADSEWQNRTHFFAVASKVMRHILIDHAKAKHAEKRGGTLHAITFIDAIHNNEHNSLDLLKLNDALTRLGEDYPRQAQVVEYKFFGGLTNEEIAELLETSERTIKRDWNMARLWLFNELNIA